VNSGSVLLLLFLFVCASLAAPPKQWSGPKRVGMTVDCPTETNIEPCWCEEDWKGEISVKCYSADNDDVNRLFNARWTASHLSDLYIDGTASLTTIGTWNSDMFFEQIAISSPAITSFSTSVIDTSSRNLTYLSLGAAYMSPSEQEQLSKSLNNLPVVTDISIGGISNLYDLPVIKSNTLQLLHLVALPGLRSISKESLDPSNQPKRFVLSLAGDRIGDMATSKTKNTIPLYRGNDYETTIDLSDNDITDFDPEIIEYIPGVERKIFLDLRDNPIQKLDVRFKEVIDKTSCTSAIWLKNVHCDNCALAWIFAECNNFGKSASYQHIVGDSTCYLSGSKISNRTEVRQLDPKKYANCTHFPQHTLMNLDL